MQTFKKYCRRWSRKQLLLMSLAATTSRLLAFTPTFSGFWSTNSPLQSWRRYDMAISSEVDGQRDNSPEKSKANWISTEQLDNLRESVDIISVIESYGLDQFQRKGDSRATAICPFHDDKNPSLNIDGNRRIYKCFSCGAGGDVFRFVQEFSKVQGQEMPFYQAVRHVSTEFGDGAIVASARSPKMSEEERKRKDRIYLANAAAADFYRDCLLKPFAGGARYHLSSRGLTPATVRTFALGFAPDFYFTKGSRNQVWGEGSLVSHLQKFGFSPKEILESGLAIRTKKAENEFYKSLGTNHSEAEDFDYSSIMDRFRGRIVVPIFDSSGKKVLGFGGRVLPEQDGDAPASKFQAPKYLNSPESTVFQKKNILFAKHHAKDQSFQGKNVGARDPFSSSVVIVEGYMDAIALWAIGIRGAVSSMGTAISPEQMSAAARTAGTGKGRVFLCLDNDKAGVAAVERLCSNGILADTAKNHAVEIAIASLPDGLKDPAEFVESRASSVDDYARVAQEFRLEVLQKAVDWTDWYLQKIIASYDPLVARGRPGSFSNIFEQIANFLATSFRPGDRTKRAYEVSLQLAGLMAEETNMNETSGAVQIQLESDLIAETSRIADAKEAILRRTEALSQDSTPQARVTLSALSRGYGPNSADGDQDKLSWKNITAGVRKNNTEFRFGKPSRSAVTKSKGRRMTLRPRTKKEAPPKALTPHFAGFQFQHKSDEDWLAFPREKKVKAKDAINSVGGDYQEKVDPVYFFSNDYHGHQFLTSDARNAGYESGKIEIDELFLQSGVASMVKQDTKNMVLVSEDMLLKELVLSHEARTTVKNVLDARNKLSFPFNVTWSSDEKEWLFSSLVIKIAEIPAKARSPEDLRVFLAERPDAPQFAFKTIQLANSTMNGKNNPESSAGDNDVGDDLNVEAGELGSLDRFFAEEDDMFAVSDGSSIPENVRRTRFVQDLFQTFLAATTAQRAHRIREELLAAVSRKGMIIGSSELETTTGTTETEHASSTSNVRDGGKQLGSSSPTAGLSSESPEASLPEKVVESSEQDERISQLTIEYNEAIQSVQALAESSKQITARLIAESNSDGGEGRMSVSLQADLAATVDDHLINVTEMQKSSDFQKLNVEESEKEPYEDALERMQEEWGEWANEDYVWSPAESGQRPLNNGEWNSLIGDSNEEDESLDEAIERIDNEWGDWDEKPQALF